jgi:pimeloyl-ACP methyl ester carboxylesterase
MNGSPTWIAWRSPGCDASSASPIRPLWGDRDRLVPVRHAHRVQTTFPHAEVQVWEGMGHHPQRERIGPFSALLERLCRVADAEPVPVPAAASPVAGASGDAAA